MTTSESLLIHRGRLIVFQCRCSNTNSDFQSVLSVRVYLFQHESKCFKKLSFHTGDALVTVIAGKCNILSGAKVVCYTTGVVEPCVLLRCDTNRLSCYKIYQLRSLFTLTEVLDSEKTALSCSLQNNQCFVVNGPSLLCMNSSDSEVIYMKRYHADTVLIKTHLPHVKSKVFLLEAESYNNDTKFTFIGQQPPEKASSVTCLAPAEQSSVKNGWVHLNIFINSTLQTISANCSERYSQLPPVYAPITTSLYPTQVSIKGCCFLLTTTYDQLVEISNGKVSNVCDIPFPHCSSIHVVGGEGYEVAVLVNQTAKCCCAVNLRHFTIARVWKCVPHVASGTLVSDCQVLGAVVLFRSNLEENFIDRSACTLISDWKDVMKKKVDVTGTAFRLKSSDDLHMDTECDLFSSLSRDENPAEKSPVLIKVIESFNNSVDRHRRVVNELRRTLSQHGQVLSSAAQALLEMNNNLKLTDKSLENRSQTIHPLDLIDLFSAEPIVRPEASNDPSERLLQLGNTWQRVIDGQWVIGFHLTNSGKRCFRHFAVLMHQSSHCEVTDGFSKSQSMTTKHFKVSDLLKFQTFKSENDTRTSQVVCVDPGEEFVVTARRNLPIFDAASHFPSSYSVAIMGTAEEQHGRSNENCLIFQAEDVRLSATGMATNAFALEVQRFNDASSEEWMEDYTAILACHDHTSAVNLSSTTSDVEDICKVALKSVGFEQCQSMYICKRVGALYLVLVQVQPLEKQHAVINVSCKSQFEESLLLSYIREQFPNQLEIKQKLDLDGQRSPYH